MEVETATRQNRDIESFILSSGELEIDFLFGVSEYAHYIEDLRLLSMGLGFQELGISERRAACRPRMLVEWAGTYRFADESTISDESKTANGSIALLQLRGVMRADSGLSSPGIDSLITSLRDAYANENIAGVIIESTSGGGESMAGNKLANAIGERNKPVVLLGHLAASAAYRVGAAADEIIAAGDAAEFGSIGTMVTLDSQILNTYRERFQDFYGAAAPRKNGEHRQAIAGDFSGIQELVTRKTVAFQQEIARARPLRGNEARIAETLNGSVYDALEAKSRGLVDMIGNMQTAVKRIQALRGKY